MLVFDVLFNTSLYGSRWWFWCHLGNKFGQQVSKYENWKISFSHWRVINKSRFEFENRSKCDQKNIEKSRKQISFLSNVKAFWARFWGKQGVVLWRSFRKNSIFSGEISEPQFLYIIASEGAWWCCLRQSSTSDSNIEQPGVPVHVWYQSYYKSGVKYIKSTLRIRPNGEFVDI